MLIWTYLMLSCVSVWGGLVNERAVNRTDLHKTIEVADNKDDTVKETILKRACPKSMAAIAQKAAAEAKCALQAQNAAACKAAHMAKIQLAQKAIQAAKAAQAALEGRQASIAQLQQEVKSAQNVVSQNVISLRILQESVNTALQAASQAAALNKLMCQATNLSVQLKKTAAALFNINKLVLQTKCRDLAFARNRMVQVQQKLRNACADCAATKQAAQSACEAAHAACKNARKKKRSVSNGRIESHKTSTSTRQ